MRSLRYIAMGKPYNMDDCIDYAEKIKDKGQANVLVQILVEEFATFEWVLDELHARFEWSFPDGKTAKYKNKFGGIFSHESGERRKRSIDNANYRLNEAYERLKFKGITVQRKKLESDSCETALPQFGNPQDYEPPKKKTGKKGK